MYYCAKCHPEKLTVEPCRHAERVRLSRLDGWQGGEYIATGSNGRVYKCTADGQARAAKIIDLRKARDEAAEYRRNFAREERALRRLRHDHVIALAEAGEDEEVLYLATEWLDTTLRKRMDRPLPLREALQYAVELADALTYAHDHEVLHRDLKPENIGFAGDRLVLFDFGLAGHRTPGTSKTTGVLGTYPYAAPEQLLTKDSSVASDVYGFGAVLYELVAGRHHRPQRFNRSLDEYLQQPVPPWPEGRAPSAELDKVVRACLAWEPAERPGAMWRVQDVLGECLDRLDLDFAGLVDQREQVGQALAADRAALVRVQATHTRLSGEVGALKEARTAAEAASAQAERLEAAARTAALEEKAKLDRAIQAARKALLAEQAALEALRREAARGPTMGSSASSGDDKPGLKDIADLKARLALLAAPPPPAAPKPGDVMAPATPFRPALRLAPAGRFTMGSPADEPGRYDNEVQHPVILTKALLVMETPVTQGQWRALLDTSPSYFTGDDRLPVEGVNWFEAVAFANALSTKDGLAPAYAVKGTTGNLGCGLKPGETYARGDFEMAQVSLIPGAPGFRLPTEAEWEYLARAGTTGALYAPALDAIAWHAGNSENTTHPVGQKEANPWGLRDMLGNVWEWCGDWHGAYPAGPMTDPVGPPTGVLRVVRGGAWSNDARRVRAAFRGGVDPVGRNLWFGFRLVRAPSS